VKVITQARKDKESYDQQIDDGSTVQCEREVEITENLVLCRSEARREKELAIISKAEERFLGQLEALAERVRKGRLKDQVKIQHAIGRIKARNTRVSGFYKVTLEALISTDQPIKEKKSRAKKQPVPIAGRVMWSRDDERFHAGDELLGCYVLRTDKLDLHAEQYWQLYISLNHAEDGFRALKSDLGLRPNHHRTEGRVEAHIFISILAYHLLHHVLYALQLQGDQRCWFTLRRILETHCYTTILMPTADGRLYRLRQPGQPEETQRDIYRKLEISVTNLPATKIVAGATSTL
jgi:transposase